MRRHATAIALALSSVLAANAAGGEAWHESLYLGRGGAWRQRVRVDVRNEMDRPAAGDVVTLRIGKGAGEADLAGAAAEAVRVCDANGVEWLYAIASPAGAAVRRGPIPARATLTVPVECPPRAAARCYVYFDNPDARAVPDFLAAGRGVRNGSLEHGTGEAPTAWRHDAQDDAHRLDWTTEQPHGGRRCLKTVVADDARPTWIAARQGGIHVSAGARYVMTAWVRAEGVKGFAGWYAHVGSAAKPMMIAPMLSGGAGTYGWKKVAATFTAPAGADTASLGTVLRGTGTAWFDDVSLTCLTPPKLSAVAAAPERLELKELGAGAPWPAAPDAAALGPRRTPLRTANLTGRPLRNAWLSVDAASLRGGPTARAVLRDGARELPTHRLGELVVFQADVPARTVRTFHLYHRKAEPPRAGDDRRGYVDLLAGPANLVRNGSFERGTDAPDGWPGSAEGARPAGTQMRLDRPGLFGERCVRLRVPHSSKTAWTGWRQDVPVRPGGTYLYAAWLKCEDIRGGSVQLHAHYRNAAGQLCRKQQFAGVGPPVGGTKDWTLLAGRFTMPEDIATFQLHLTMNATGTVWHDGAVLLEVAPARVRPVEARKAAVPAGLAVWPVNAIVKVFREDLPPAGPAPARIGAAGNEAEPLQLALRSPTALEKVRVEIDPPAGPRGAKLGDVSVGVVGTVPIDHPTNYYQSNSPAWHRKFPAGAGGSDGWAGPWPDPILPRKTFDLAASRTQPIWITVHVPTSAPAGEYRGAVRLLHAGKLLKKVPLTVRVWGFALPKVTRFPAIYDVRMRSPLWRRPGETRDKALRRMWRFLAARRLCPDRIQPEPVLRYRGGKVHADFAAYDKAAAYYFDELKLPHSYAPWLFYLFGWGHPPSAKFSERPYKGESPYEGVDRAALRPEFRRAYQACLKAYWDHVRAKGWADRITLYISDEPHDRHPEIREQMKALCAMIHEVDPKIPIYSSTWHHQPAWDGSLDVWGIGHYGIVPVDKMAELRAAGKRLWFTTDGQMCTDTPYCAVERLLPHYAFHYGADAYEFWGVDWLTYDPYEFGWHRYIHQSDTPGQSYYVRYPNGDGYLAYPGSPVGHDGIVSSIRLEQARDGVEDYEYLRILRERIARAKAAGRDAAAGEAALKEAAGLVTIPNAGGRYSTRILPDPAAVLRTRERLARAIERMNP